MRPSAHGRASTARRPPAFPLQDACWAPYPADTAAANRPRRQVVSPPTIALGPGPRLIWILPGESRSAVAWARGIRVRITELNAQRWGRARRRSCHWAVATGKAVVTVASRARRYCPDSRRPPKQQRHDTATEQGTRERSRTERKARAMIDRANPKTPGSLYTRIKKSPYYYGSRRHGVALYSFYNHHYHPRHYGDPFEEYWQLLEGVTLWDVGGAERQVEITGPDAFEFTNMLRRAICTSARSGSASTRSSPTSSAGSSTTPCCCGWRRTASGSRSPTPTCCSGARASRATPGWTCRSSSPTSRRSRSRGRSPRRS